MKCWLQISSGSGPEECCWTVAQVEKQIAQEAKISQLQWKILQRVLSQVPGNFCSLLNELEGNDVLAFATRWIGTIQWIGKSNYRPHHKRKNWFVDVCAVEIPMTIQWHEDEFTIETKRGAGPGGQHRNKRETAVRVRHGGTDLSVSASTERSQNQNKQVAFSQLCGLLSDHNALLETNARSRHRLQHYRLQRGNPIRIYSGLEFRRID